MKKLAIISTHPIQYNAPWFQLLAKRKSIEIRVFYTWSQAENAVKDHTFGKDIIWDIPLLEGYNYEFVENVSKKPGSHHFYGIECPTLIGRIEKYKPDALLFFGWNFKSHLYAIYYFKRKIPVWFRGDSTLLNENGIYKTKLRRIFLKRLYSYIDKALYVGEANKSYFLKHGLLDEQLVYAPHAIDNDRFREADQKKQKTKIEEWRKELNYREADIVVVFAGKFEAIKQPKFLIEAVQKSNLQRSMPIKLLMVGNGPLESNLKKFAENDANIQFLPFQNQTKMPLVYRLGSLLCLPSLSETWGLVVNEAMASGKPVIVSNKVGCAANLVKHGENGYHFIYDKQNELIEILDKLSLTELHRLGENALADIQNYDFNSIVKAIENEMHKLKN